MCIVQSKCVHKYRDMCKSRMNYFPWGVLVCYASSFWIQSKAIPLIAVIALCQSCISVCLYNFENLATRLFVWTRSKKYVLFMYFREPYITVSHKKHCSFHRPCRTVFQQKSSSKSVYMAIYSTPIITTAFQNIQRRIVKKPNYINLVHIWAYFW